MIRSRLFLIAIAFWLVLAALPAGAEGVRYVFLEMFDDAAPLGAPAALPADWVVVDANADGATWAPRLGGGARGGPAVRYLSHATNAANDWLFTPAIALSPGITYTLSFNHRVTSAASPHELTACLGNAPTTAAMTTVIMPARPIATATDQQTSVTFTVGAAGNYHVGFRVSTPANRLAIYLDNVIVARPATDLAVTLQLDKVFYTNSNTFISTEPVKTLAYIKNVSAAPLKVNALLSVGHAGDPQVVLAYLVTGPTGQPVPFKMRYRLPMPGPEDFKVLAPGKAASKFDDINNGAIDFTAPGTYTIRALYRNIHPSADGTAWRGWLLSDPVTLQIQ